METASIEEAETRVSGSVEPLPSVPSKTDPEGHRLDKLDTRRTDLDETVHVEREHRSYGVRDQLFLGSPELVHVHVRPARTRVRRLC